MIKAALVTIVISLLASCEGAEKTQKEIYNMQDDILLHDALIQANSSETNKDYSEDDIVKTIDATFRLISHKTDMTSEMKTLGSYQPHFPKTGRIVRYSFETKNIHTTIFTYPSNTVIEDIYISDTDNELIITRFQLDLNKLDITYSNYHSRESETNSDRYDVDFTYKSKNYKDVLIDFSAVNLTEDEIEHYNNFKLLPKNITSIRVYSIKESES